MFQKKMNNDDFQQKKIEKKKSSFSRFMKIMWGRIKEFIAE